jgi:hypothetical protein
MQPRGSVDLAETSYCFGLLYTWTYIKKMSNTTPELYATILGMNSLVSGVSGLYFYFALDILFSGCRWLNVWPSLEMHQQFSVMDV